LLIASWTSVLLFRFFMASMPADVPALQLAVSPDVRVVAYAFAMTLLAGLGFGLAPASAQGQYQGLLGIGMSVGAAVSPVLMIGLVLSLGRVGWVGLGGLFALSGLAAPAVARWGARTRLAVTDPKVPETAVMADDDDPAAVVFGE
jgi:hypothetical protein